MKCQFSGFPLGTVKKIKHPVEDLKIIMPPQQVLVKISCQTTTLLINVQTTKNNLTGPVQLASQLLQLFLNGLLRDIHEWDGPICMVQIKCDKVVAYLKLVSAIFYQMFIFSPNDRPSKTMINVFYFTQKVLFVLQIFKFLYFFPFLSTLSRFIRANGSGIINDVINWLA